MVKKKCTECSKIKDEDAFREYKKSASGVSYFRKYCRDCERKKNAKWREKNRKMIAEYSKKYRNSTKGKIVYQRRLEKLRGTPLSAEIRKERAKKRRLDKKNLVDSYVCYLLKCQYGSNIKITKSMIEKKRADLKEKRMTWETKRIEREKELIFKGKPLSRKERRIGKVCFNCNTWKSSDYYKVDESRGRLRTYCIECEIKRGKTANRKMVDKLTDSYVEKLMARREIPKDKIPKTLYDLTRTKILTKRVLKETK